MDLQSVTDNLAREVRQLGFTPPVAHVYNPLVYARKPHVLYLQRYGGGIKEAVFVGMNPGPWGMAQTGVPFGEVSLVRDWLGIEAEVAAPEREHPAKRVTGFACRRSEVSGKRLWGFFRGRCGEAERFFDRFFVINYCPLLFLDEGGRNITPDRLRPVEREALLAVCDEALRRLISCLKPTRVIGIGAFAAQRAEIALGDFSIPVGRILHPSPANPAANRNWQETVLRQLGEQGVLI